MVDPGNEQSLNDEDFTKALELKALKRKKRTTSVRLDWYVLDIVEEIDPCFNLSRFVREKLKEEMVRLRDTRDPFRVLPGEDD